MENYDSPVTWTSERKATLVSAMVTGLGMTKVDAVGVVEECVPETVEAPVSEVVTLILQSIVRAGRGALLVQSKLLDGSLN